MKEARRSPVEDKRASVIEPSEDRMASASPRRRAPAVAPARKTVKSSVIVDVDLHARWSAAASLRGLDRNAFAVEAIRSATKHIIIIDRSRTRADDGDSSAPDDRQVA
jgi:hypothetical protein